MTNSYLPLTEYSSKYKVSISTLRRRIKADDIKYVFEDGKYLIMDEPVGTHQKVHRPSQSSEQTFLVEMPPQPALHSKSDTVTSGARWRQVTESPVNSKAKLQTPNEGALKSSGPSDPPIFSAQAATWQKEIQDLSLKEHHEPILTAANRLLTELKKAYTQVLQEKEEQIMHLKEEITDLKTLVRVLESDNDRYKR